ncbi:MAG TPA: hypothetical protein VLA21_04860 [Candidatus Limnocylindria bacterium]|nr:hypothetical protein [Candidatus Limnocylindria bacterium]
MKKSIIILALALLVALPVFGLSAEEAPAVTEETQTAAPANQYGRRWTQAPAQQAGRGMARRNQTPAQGWNAGSPRFVDENSDGVCDLCGNAQGQNGSGPRFTDENNDGVCDLCGNAQGTNPNAPGFTDADGDGVCDNLGSGRQGGMRGMRGMRGRNRR